MKNLKLSLIVLVTFNLLLTGCLAVNEGSKAKRNPDKNTKALREKILPNQEQPKTDKDNGEELAEEVIEGSISEDTSAKEVVMAEEIVCDFGYRVNNEFVAIEGGSAPFNVVANREESETASQNFSHKLDNLTLGYELETQKGFVKALRIANTKTKEIIEFKTDTIANNETQLESLNKSHLFLESNENEALNFGSHVENSTHSFSGAADTEECTKPSTGISNVDICVVHKEDRIKLSAKGSPLLESQKMISLTASISEDYTFELICKYK